ncbi:MAG: ABC transporter permease [Phycisphaeraceae bacterium]|nr:ABC transporter permease [Phycisphaeraceae bacterium]
MLIPRIARLGQWTLARLEGLGRFTRFASATAKWMFRGVGSWSRWHLLLPQLFNIGTRSIPVILLLGAFVGMVLAVEAFDQFNAIGQAQRLGGVINVSVVKQIGPVLAAVMIAGRVGGSVSAELGTMRVTEQLDAMRVIGTDPIAYLVVPRVIACLIMIPMLTVISDLMGIGGAYAVTVKGFGVNARDYWQFSRDFVGSWEVLSGILKSVLFGLTIGLISCYKGFHCREGAAGVGRAATESFVTSFVMIIIINFFLAKFLKDLYVVIYGPDTFNAFTS